MPEPHASPLPATRLPAAPRPAAPLPATRLIHARLLNEKGEPIGRVDDLIVHLPDEHGHPPLAGLKARIGRESRFVPTRLIATLQPGRAQLAGDASALGPFERRPGDVLIDADILDRKLIDVTAGRLIHANDVGLALTEVGWSLIGVDASRRGLMARLLPGGSRDRVRRRPLVDWANVEPFVGHVPTARLLLPLRRLKRLHPAQIADLIEGASHEQGAEIISAVHGDRGLEADVFEELDTPHQVGLLEARTDQEIAAVLADMAADDAADLINELDQTKRGLVLALLPDRQRLKIRNLLIHNPTTAGGLMSPDFIAVPATASVDDALAAIRATPELSWQSAAMVFLTDEAGRLSGAAAVVSLVRSRPEARLGDALDEPLVARISVDDDLQDLALTMSDYNLTVAPVVDRDQRIVGIITADDLIEALIPEGWRRRRSAESQD